MSITKYNVENNVKSLRSFEIYPQFEFITKGTEYYFMAQLVSVKFAGACANDKNTGWIIQSFTRPLFST